jgi:hypothetical protein
MFVKALQISLDSFNNSERVVMLARWERRKREASRVTDDVYPDSDRGSYKLLSPKQYFDVQKCLSAVPKPLTSINCSL